MLIAFCSNAYLARLADLNRYNIPVLHGKTKLLAYHTGVGACSKYGNDSQPVSQVRMAGGINAAKEKLSSQPVVVAFAA
jgi:hypothetical protein